MDADDEEEAELWRDWVEEEDEEHGLAPDDDPATFDDEDEDDEDDEEEADGEPRGAEDHDDEEEDERGPSGPRFPPRPGHHTVRQGDCVLSVARHYRMTVATIWDHPGNAALRELRSEPNQLMPGDALFVPAPEEPAVTVGTERRHRFSLGAHRQCKLVLRLLEAGEPRQGLAYTLYLEGDLRTGKTDGDGRLQETVPMSATAGELVLHDPRGDQRFPVRLGHLDPIEEATGVQARLNHLGLVCGAVDGRPGRRTRSALLAFQRSRELRTTGVADAATLAELREAHGS